MAKQGWGSTRPEGRDAWGRPIYPGRPVGGVDPRLRRDLSNPVGGWEVPPHDGGAEPVYSGPQYPREMVGYGARRDATDPRATRSGARMAMPATQWGLRDGLPTVPTVLIAGAAVILAFLIGHLTGGGGGSSVAATTVTTVAAVPTTAARPTSHTVAVGESLSSIATSFGLTTQDLASFNNISNINHVFVGEVLKIPTPTTLPAPPTTVAKKR